LNVYELDYENESDEEGRGTEKSGHWKVSCHVTEASENAEESDIADAGAVKKLRISS
jgi:hypothetical protein